MNFKLHNFLLIVKLLEKNQTPILIKEQLFHKDIIKTITQGNQLYDFLDNIYYVVTNDFLLI